MAWGLTEPGGGSDLLAGSLTATRHGSGWRLSGRKWPVNNATRGNLMCVLARTEPGGGSRGFSLFLIDKRATPAGTVRPLPKMPTHGIRGADISGLEFDGARVPAHALVGKVGGGIELVLKSLQLTRIVYFAVPGRRMITPSRSCAASSVNDACTGACWPICRTHATPRAAPWPGSSSPRPSRTPPRGRPIRPRSS